MAAEKILYIGDILYITDVETNRLKYNVYKNPLGKWEGIKMDENKDPYTEPAVIKAVEGKDSLEEVLTCLKEGQC